MSPDSGKQPANVVTATTTMEVIQEAQLIAPGQVPVRPSSAKDTQAVGLLHLLRYTLQVLKCCHLSPVLQVSSV